MAEFTPPVTHTGYDDGTNGSDQMRDVKMQTYVDRVDADIRELRNDVKGWKLWVVGTGVTIFIGLAAIMISLLTYHATVMQSQLSGIQSQMSQYQSQLNAQMQTFSEYVKAVTHPQEPQVPKAPKKNE